MNVELLSAHDLTKEFKVTVPFQALQNKKDTYIKSRANKVKIDGFRPGKVPHHILEQRLGGDALNQALRSSIDDAIAFTVKEHKIQYLNQPNVDFDEFEEGKDLVFTVKFEVMPEFDLQDFSTISLEKLTVAVAETDIKQALDKLYAEYKPFKPITLERSSQANDRVSCTVSLKHQGKSLKGYQKLTITFDLNGKDILIEKIADVLKDMKIGQNKVFQGTVIEGFADTAIAGKTVEVSLSVDKILELKTFDLNDDFAKEFGQESLEGLKEQIKQDLEKNYNSIARLYLKRHLLDALEVQYDFLLPSSMVDNEFKVIWQHLQNEIADAKAKGQLDETEGKSEEELNAEYKKIAERRVRLGLIISKIAKEQKIQMTQDELRDAIFREALRYSGREKQVIQYYRNHPEMIDRLVAPLLEDKVVNYISDHIQTTDINLDVPALKEKVKGVIPTSFDEDDVNA